MEKANAGAFVASRRNNLRLEQLISFLATCRGHQNPPSDTSEGNSPRDREDPGQGPKGPALAFIPAPPQPNRAPK